MSQQRAPTLNDIELRYHDSKTNTDALVATLLREYKGKFAEVLQQIQILKIENQKLKDKYEPKIEEKKLEAPATTELTRPEKIA